MGVEGECGSECRTVARACEQVMDSADISDLSGMLYKNKKRSEIQQHLCYDDGGACLKKPPRLPKVRTLRVRVGLGLD